MQPQQDSGDVCVKTNRGRLLERFLCQDIKRSIVALEHDVGHAGAPGLVLVSPVDVPEAFNAVSGIAFLSAPKLSGVLA
ncbi:hypothetical protein [Pseudarthrobacter sp. AL20]|uniref:hypothetical protein n=1 Tax=Pseudarthrobacter sp. AL20 TaxID=3042239 RepID=UPI00249AFA68|nr:hypothetical protein [Pseudarthrobacter sp. AL20]